MLNAVSDFDAKETARYNQVFVVTELVVGGTQWKMIWMWLVRNVNIRHLETT